MIEILANVSLGQIIFIVIFLYLFIFIFWIYFQNFSFTPKENKSKRNFVSLFKTTIQQAVPNPT